MKRLAPLGLGLLLLACGDDGASGGDSLLRDIELPELDVVDTEDGSLDTTPADTTPADTTPADTTAADTTPADTTPADTTSADTTPADTTSADTTPADTTPADTTPADTDAGPKPTCITLPAQHTRHLVMARPYDVEGDGASVWEVYPIGANAALGPRVTSIDLGPGGRAVYGKVRFTPDGALGLIAHDRGEVSVIAIGPSGEVAVPTPPTDFGPYVSSIELSGDDVFLVDGNWANNGGGIYHTKLACDGTLSPPTRLYPTKLANALALVPGPSGLDHLVMAREAVDNTTGSLHHVRKVANTWTRAGGVDLFADPDVNLSAMALTRDGRFALVGDNSEFTDAPNRVGVASLDPLALRQVVTPLNDPFDLVASPFDDAVLVVLGYANRVNVLRYSPDAATPFTNAGSPAYATQVPQLPGDAVLVGGEHAGTVYVVENTAIRVFRFNGDGTVTDLGRQLMGDPEDYRGIPGAIGVQP